MLFQNLIGHANTYILVYNTCINLGNKTHIFEIPIFSLFEMKINLECKYQGDRNCRFEQTFQFLKAQYTYYLKISVRKLYVSGPTSTLILHILLGWLPYYYHSTSKRVSCWGQIHPASHASLRLVCEI